MSNHLVIIKLGGSLITDKSKPNSFYKERVVAIGREIRALRQKGLHFILGTGAGYVHLTAHQYGLRGGAASPEQLFGMCATHNEAQHLSNMVAEVLTDAGVPVFTLSPSALFSCRDKQITKSNLEPVKNLLASDIVPVLHGDTLIDTVRGTTIFSSEKALHECLKAFRGQYDKATLLYLMDIEGVRDKQGQVVPALGPEDEVFSYGTLEHDVTGGILNKIQNARAALEYADAVYIASGKIPGVIGKVIAGEPVGTRLVKK